MQKVASWAFVEELFRKLMLDNFGFQFGLVPMNNGWAGRTFMRMCFPSASTSQLLVQWFQNFMKNQLTTADILKFSTDFSAALLKDIDAVLKKDTAGGYPAGSA